MPHDLHALLSFHHQRFQHAFRYSSRRSRKYHGSRKRGIEKNRLQQQQHQQHQQHLLAQQVGSKATSGRSWWIGSNGRSTRLSNLVFLGMGWKSNRAGVARVSTRRRHLEEPATIDFPSSLRSNSPGKANMYALHSHLWSRPNSNHTSGSYATQAEPEFPSKND